MHWLSTRSGSPAQYELPVSGISAYPTRLERDAFLPAGYSHRLAPTGTAGECLAVWVQGDEGRQDVYVRYVRR